VLSGHFVNNLFIIGILVYNSVSIGHNSNNNYMTKILDDREHIIIILFIGEIVFE